MKDEEFLQMIQSEQDLTNKPLNKDSETEFENKLHLLRDVSNLTTLNLSYCNPIKAVEALGYLKSKGVFKSQKSLNTLLMPRKQPSYKRYGLFDKVELVPSDNSLEARLKVIEENKKREEQKISLISSVAKGEASLPNMRPKGRMSYSLGSKSSDDNSIIFSLGDAIFNTGITEVKGLEHIKPHSREFIQLICWHNELKNLSESGHIHDGCLALYLRLTSFLGTEIYSYAGERSLKIQPEHFKHPHTLQQYPQTLQNLYSSLGLGDFPAYKQNEQEKAYKEALTKVYEEVGNQMRDLKMKIASENEVSTVTVDLPSDGINYKP